MDLDFQPSPAVSINGEAIRRIREEKCLTQLYVSKVVGVTTDTVSRWENNRYPTIRRDNALKLAEALEVQLEEILQQTNPREEDIAPTGESRPKKAGILILSVVLLSLIIFFVYRNNGVQPPTIDATRLLPPYAAPGSRVLIRVKVASDKPLKGMILREDYPQGWKLVEANPPASSLDNLVGMARWIFRNPKLQTTISYMLEVPKDAPLGKSIDWTGELIANPAGYRSATPLKTVGHMEVRPFHWADTNGDQIIEDLEILEVSNLLEETGTLHLEWDLLEDIWDAGGYQWQADKNCFVPLRVPPEKPKPQ
ncbi:MAG: helix-turn-helix transcriptional regulator [Deltaproteobacteria bacterium]|nr:helix-turn-helix transcriptional regulator [Deltaproteobacteria bacterium]